MSYYFINLVLFNTVYGLNHYSLVLLYTWYKKENNVIILLLKKKFEKSKRSKKEGQNLGFFGIFQFWIILFWSLAVGPNLQGNLQ